MFWEPGNTSAGRFEPESSEETWVPGAIEVVFGDPSQAGLSDWNFNALAERTAYSEAWSQSLKELLQSIGLAKWGPSFPLSYPWSEASVVALRNFYEQSGRNRFVTFHFPKNSELISLADELEKLPEIIRATPIPRISPPSSPLDEPLVGTSDQIAAALPGGLDNQWYLFRCGVDKAWTKSSGAGVVIADIDWGFNLFHRELSDRVTLRQNTIENSTVVSNGNRIRHGTAALALAGADVNGLGMAGVAFKSQLWAIQAGDDSVEDHKFWLSAIDFVRSEKSEFKKVIILEIQTKKLGNIEMSNTINKAIIDAISAGVVVCVPAGNGGRDAGRGDDGKCIPLTGSVLVGATRYDSDRNMRDVSNVGPRIVVYAPGDIAHDVTCSVPGETDYSNWFGGTSGAVAKVAGVVALMLSVNSKLTQEEICEILKQSKTPVVDFSLKDVGVLLNAEQAVCEALRRAGSPCQTDQPVRA